MHSNLSSPGAAFDLLVSVVYELLDAHDDVTRLVTDHGLDDEPHWAAHLDYLRGLQRVAREDLAHAAVAVA